MKWQIGLSSIFILTVKMVQVLTAAELRWDEGTEQANYNSMNDEQNK